MNYKSYRFLLFALLAFGLGQTKLDAAIVWTGIGESGVDPFGHVWLFQNSEADLTGVVSWGIPGRGIGTTTYLGDESLQSITLEFFDLPVGVVLNSVGFPLMAIEPFAGQDDEWTAEFLSPTAIRFSAPTFQRTLDPGEQFFAFVTFNGDVNFSTVNFRATYIAAVPEPTFATVNGLFFLGLLFRGRRVRSLRRTSATDIEKCSRRW